MAGGRSVRLCRPSARPEIEDATAFLAERVHFDNDRVRQRVTNRQHPDHVVSLVSVPDTRLVQVDHAPRNFRALMCKYDRLVHVLLPLMAVPMDVRLRSVVLLPLGSFLSCLGDATASEEMETHT